MGWILGIPKPQGSSIRHELDRMLTMPEQDGESQQVLASTLIGMREYYAAVEQRRRTHPPRTKALVFLIETGRGTDRGTWGYKGMNEDWGPYACQCPEKILDLLDPPETEASKRWRERCRAHARTKAAMRSLRHGQTIHLHRPVNVSGQEHSKFRVVQLPGRRNPVFSTGTQLVRISARTLQETGFDIL